MRHVTDADMELLLGGRMDPAEAKDVMVHLLSPCPSCRKYLEVVTEILEDDDEYAEGGGPGFLDPCYDAAMDRAFAAAQAALPHWREEADRMARNLAEAPKYPRGVLDLPKTTPDEFRWSWVETLLQTIPTERYRDPRQMLLLALATEGQAKQLRQSGLYPPYLAADLHARALGELANAYRINEQLADARQLLNESIVAQRVGSGDPLILARLFDIGSSVGRDERRLDQAIEALDCAGRIYEEVGETHLAGRALINKGICTAHLGAYTEAAVALRKGLDLIDPARDPHLAAVGRYESIHSLVDCGDHRQASSLLLESGLRKAFADEPLNLLKLRWLEGKIHVGLGRLRRAESAFTAVRKGFFAKAQHYDAALAGLDLLALWLHQGRLAEAEELAADVLETFLALGIQSEARKALRSLEEACRHRAATPPLVKKVVDFLRLLPWQPALRYA